MNHSKKNTFIVSVIVCSLFFTTVVVNSYGVYEGDDIIGNPSQIPQSPEFTPNEVIVKYKENQSPISLRTLSESRQLSAFQKEDVDEKLRELTVFNSAMGITDEEEVQLVSTDDIFLYKTDGTRSVTQLVAQYESRDDVEYAEPNYLYYPMKTPNDPSFRQLWGMTKINAPQAWDEQTGSKSVLMAIIDTGVDTAHPDLKNNISETKQFVSGCSSGDQQGHGTHVAGTAGAVGNNSVGVVGVSWNVGILALKVFCAGDASPINIAQAVDYAVQKKAKVINMSLGSPGVNQTLKNAISNAVSNGTVVVVSAGNSGPGTANQLYPGSDPKVISVAATTTSDTRASFSSTGSSVDVAAPGAGIYSTTPNGRYGSKSGTSMASPHVTGLVALMFAKDPNLTPQQVKSILEQTADDLGTRGRDNDFGYGRINAKKALDRVTGGGGGSGPTVTPPPGKGAECLQRGDYDCDGRVELADFELWRRDGMVPFPFFEYWRRAMYVVSGLLDNLL